jgi:Right handed beta helix region
MQSAKSRTIRVPEDQPTIAAAMAAAGAGDTVKLDPGIYKETLVLKTGVHVVGGPSTIDATGLEHGIYADKSVTCCATVEKLTVQNASDNGVTLDGARGVHILACAFRACGVVEGSSALRMDDGAQASIESSEFSGSGYAGLRVLNSDLSLKNSQVFGNSALGLDSEASTVDVATSTFHDNTFIGVFVSSGVATIDGAHITDAVGVYITGTGSGTLHGNVLENNSSYGVFVEQSTAVLEQNQIQGSADTAVLVTGGSDLSNQKRSTIHLASNSVTGSGTGLQIFNSDAWSDGDHFDHNGIGVLAAFGTSIIATQGTALGNTQGIFARDALEYYFCGNADCTVTQLAVATVHLSIDHMHLDNNGAGGLTAWGSSVSAQASTMNGNGDGVVAFSGSDYELGDGIVHHLETPGVVSVQGSQMNGNTGTGATEEGTSALRLVGNLIQGNGGGVQVFDGGRVQLTNNVVQNNKSDGILISHGSTGELDLNNVKANAGSGVDVIAGWDPSNQLRSTARLARNVVMANAIGFQVINSDATSEGDSFDQNVGYGLNVVFGAALEARGGSVSSNQYGGAWARDMNFFCTNADCTLQQLAVATVRLSLDRMRIEHNAFNGCAATGGQVKITASLLNDNGGNGGVIAFSGWDYDLGDGVGRHVEMPGLVTVRNSSFTGNTAWGAIVKGESTLDLGGPAGGGNSFVSNGTFAVVNQTSPAANVSAEGNWWGTGTAASIAALMSGPVDFVPFLMSPPR